MRKSKRLNSTLQFGPVSVYLSSPKHLPLRPVHDELQDSINSVKNFFSGEIDLKKEIKVKLIDTRSEFDDAFGEKTENWMSGGVHRGVVVMFHPETLAIASTHSKKEFPQILTHEICHVVTNRMNPKFSWWLSEGIAQYVARQNVAGNVSSSDLDHFISESLFTNKDYGDFINHDGYKIAYMVTERLIAEYGRDTVMQLLKIKMNKHTEENCLSVIKKTPEEFVRFIRNITDGAKKNPASK